MRDLEEIEGCESHHTDPIKPKLMQTMIIFKLFECEELMSIKHTGDDVFSSASAGTLTT